MAFAEVILTENIKTLGAEADLVKVRRGYAHNFLIPRGKAIEATSASVKQINHLKARRAEREALELTAAEELASKVNKLKLNFTLETGETGKAFGSVTAKDIVDRLNQELKDAEVPRHAITLEHPIKESGEQEISVKLHADVVAKLKVKVTAAKPVEAEASEEDEKPRRKSAKS